MSGDEERFGEGLPFTVGVEEELLLVDARTYALAHDAERILAAIDAPAERFGPEAYASQLELRTEPCASAGEAALALETTRADARAAGATLIGVGLHPDGRLGDARLVQAERYRMVEAEMRGLIRRTPECALHVHVGMPDRETAVRVANGLREALPLLVGLAANSPWWYGRDSGMASVRAAAVRAYPGRGVPPAFESFDHYLEVRAGAAAGGGPEDYTLLWWDVRPHPRLGTVEVREMDAQARLEDVAAIAALIQGLARRAADSSPAVPSPSEALAWSCFRAARDGTSARVLHGGELVPIAHAAREAARAARAALDSGDGALDGLDRLLVDGGGAERRRAAERRGGLGEMLRELVSETAATAGG